MHCKKFKKKTIFHVLLLTTWKALTPLMQLIINAKKVKCLHGEGPTGRMVARL